MLSALRFGSSPPRSVTLPELTSNGDFIFMFLCFGSFTGDFHPIYNAPMLGAHKISGGRVIRRAVMPGQVWLKNLLRHSAASLARSESVLGDYYRRIGARMGPAGANTVLAHKLARILWQMVTHQVEYEETILAHLDKARQERQLKRLQRQARALNCQLTPL